MLEEAKQSIKESSLESSVYIGTDSKRFKKNGKWYAKYSTVIVLHIDSKHGCKIFHQSEVLPDYGNLKQRLLNEVSYATTVAQEIIEVIESRPLCVHLDLNPDPKHKSSIAVKEALGWCAGLGFDAKVKPHAWAATHAADHVVRH